MNKQLLVHAYSTDSHGGRYAVIVLTETVIWERRFPDLMSQTVEYFNVSKILDSFRGQNGYRVLSCDACNSRTFEEIILLNNDRCPDCGRDQSEARRIAHFIQNKTETELHLDSIVAASPNVEPFLQREKERRTRGR